MEYTESDIIRQGKPIRFVGDSLKSLRGIPEGCSKRCRPTVEVGSTWRTSERFQTYAHHWQGVEEIRIWDESGTYRVIYPARLADAVYVLHVFQKKSQATSKRDMEIAKQRFQRLTGVTR